MKFVAVSLSVFSAVFDSILLPKRAAKSADMQKRKNACVMSYWCTDTEALLQANSTRRLLAVLRNVGSG